MEELWRAITGYEGFYEVSNLGRVRSLDRTVPRGSNHLTLKGVVLQPCICKGYKYVNLRKGGIGGLKKVAALVTSAFEGPRPAGKQAAHENGNRLDDRAENLSWKTRVENERDKYRHGTRPLGEDVHNSALLKEQVDVIRELRAGGLTYREIASRLKIKFEAVRCVCVGRTWRHYQPGGGDGVQRSGKLGT